MESQPEFTAKYRGIPAFSVISTRNLQRSNRFVDRSLSGRLLGADPLTNGER